jgi:hypothetical protein
VSPVLVLGDQADEGNDDAPMRRVESDRRLNGRQVVAEGARANGKEPGKESKLIASEGLEGHWVIGRKAARRGGEGQKEGTCNERE